MSTVKDRGVIDLTYIEENNYVLVIIDDLEWTYAFRQEHASILQNKLNDYLGYIASGQAEEACPGKRPLIRIAAKYAYSRYAIDFLERVRAFIQNKDNICDLEWTHDPADGLFEDGFSDDLVFDETKIYPRIKKNWAEKPLEEVSLMAVGKHAPAYPDNLVMVRVMDSFIGLFMQDIGEAFTYVTYDQLPEGYDVERLNRIAFDNLIRDVSYRTSQSREKGIYGILAGGDFEAESLCLNDIWKAVSEELQDDVLIAVPTKDIVFYTKAGDKRRCRKMLKMAENMYLSNQKESPYLLFSRDVFLFSRTEEKLTVSDQYLLRV